MKPGHRRAALRVGGAVISASLLLLVERCVREPPPPPAAPSASPGGPAAPQAGHPSTAAPLRIVLPSHERAPPPVPRVRAAAPQPPARPAPALPARHSAAAVPHDHSLVGLITALIQRNPQRIVPANDVAHRRGQDAVAPPAHPHERAPTIANGPAAMPAPTVLAPPPPAAESGPASAAAAPLATPSLRDLTEPMRPREPLLGVAATPAAPAGPDQPPPAGFANDNPAASAAPPVTEPGRAPSAPGVNAAPPVAEPAAADGSPGTTPPSAATQGAAAAPAPAPSAALPDATPVPATSPIASAREPVAGTPIAPPPQAGRPLTQSAPRTASARAPQMARGRNGIAAPRAAPAAFADDDELILELTTPRRELDETIIAYSRHGVPYLPLGELARILDLAITVSDDGRYASGWVLDPGKTLALNLREGTVVVEGKPGRLAPDDAVAFDGELYLRADRFADILPLTLTANLRAQTVTVQTRGPFPFEQRLTRETAREQLRGRQGRHDGRLFARAETPWRGLDFPLIDSELRAASDTVRGTRGEGDFRLAGDLAWLTAKAFVSADSIAGLTSARLELGRRDPDARLLGPLRATEFGFGDITSAPLSLGLASVSGRGLFVTNAPLERASVFDRIELRGDMPDGYEAELYRNNILIDTAATPQEGQYRFLNIPVEFGLNVFRVVLYGPQGQRREVVRQISVGDGRLGAGEFQYAVGSVQKNRSLFALQGRDYLPGPDDGALRTTVDLQYGLSGGLTAAIGGALFDRLGTRHWLATAGLRSGMAGFAVKADLGFADGAGRAYGLGLARKLGGFSVTLNHLEYRGTFADEVHAFSDQPLRRVTELTFNGGLALGGEDARLRIPLNGTARDLEFADGRRVQSVSLAQALPLSSSLQLSHLIELDRSRAPLFATTTQLRGAFDLASLSRSSLQLRASLGYALLPTAVLTSAGLQVDRRLGERATISASAGRNFQSDQNRFGLSAIRRFNRFALALDGNYSTNPGRYSAILRLSFSLGRNPLDGRLFMAPTGLATGGAIAIHAFRDLDGDGRYEPGEPALADVRFFAGSENSATDGAGHVLLGRLGDGPRTSVRIDRDTLPDIALAPAADGVELVPRAGRILVHDYAIRALGELDGTAYFEAAGAERTVSGVIVLLLDPQGKAAARTRTGSDGSFWFEKLPAGHYRLALDPGQASRLGIALVEPQPVTIGPDGPSLRQNIRIRSVAEDKQLSAL